MDMDHTKKLKILLNRFYLFFFCRKADTINLKPKKNVFNSLLYFLVEVKGLHLLRPPPPADLRQRGYVCRESGPVPHEAVARHRRIP